MKYPKTMQDPLPPEQVHTALDGAASRGDLPQPACGHPCLFVVLQEFRDALASAYRSTRLDGAQIDGQLEQEQDGCGRARDGGQ